MVVPRPIAVGNVKLPFDIVVTHLRLRAHPGLPTMFQSVRIIFASWGFRCWPDASCLFNQHDISSVPGVSIISEAMARHYFPNQDPLGKQIAFGFAPSGGEAMREIVGVVGNVRVVALGQNPGPMNRVVRFSIISAVNRRVVGPNRCESILSSLSPPSDSNLSRLVHQRATREPLSDARTAT